MDLRPAGCPGDLGRFLSLAVDSTGKLVFSSYTSTFGDLVFGVVSQDDGLECEYVDGVPESIPSESSENTTEIMLGDDVGLYSSLALDALDRAHVAYFDQSHGRLKYAFNSGQLWKKLTVPRTGDHVVGRACSLALDSQGLPHIAFLDETEGSLKVARKYAEGRWAVEKLPTVPIVNDQMRSSLSMRNVGRMIALVLDSKDRAWVAFRDIYFGGLKVAGKQPEGWKVIEVDSGKGVGTWLDAALDSEGNMALAYHDRSSGSLKYAWNQQGALMRTVVDDGEVIDEHGARRRYPVGQHCELAFGLDGFPQILYLDGTTLNAKWIKGKHGGVFQPPEILKSEGAIGFYNQLVWGPSGMVAASCRYKKSEQGNLEGELVHWLLGQGQQYLGGVR